MERNCKELKLSSFHDPLEYTNNISNVNITIIVNIFVITQPNSIGMYNLNSYYLDVYFAMPQASGYEYEGSPMLSH